MILVANTQVLWSSLGQALLRHSGIVMLRDIGYFFGWSCSANVFHFRGQNDGVCLWSPITAWRLKFSSRKQQTYNQCSPLHESIQSHTLPLQGVSSSHWTASSMEIGHSLPLFSKQRDRTEKKQVSESERGQAREHLSMSSTNAGIQLKEGGFGSSLLSEELTYFFPVLYSTKYSGQGGKETTVPVILWNTEVLNPKLLHHYWHLPTLNFKRSLSAVYFHPSCENN